MPWLLFLFLLLPVSLTAHEVRPALLTVKQQDNNLYTAIFKQPQVQGRFLNLGIETNCEQTQTESKASSSALQETFDLACETPLAFITIEGLEKTLIDTMITVEDLNGKQDNYLVTGREPTVSMASGTATPVYLSLGMEHLFFGIDHVLFVLLLLYLVEGWRNLVKVITSFTVAHSITLALSALNIVSVSQTPVEAMIALSIVLLATEALSTRDTLVHRQPWIIAFVFGLLHGLGFAGALSQIGLPESSTVMALFLFNIGIEIGQLSIIAAALALLFAIRKAGLTIPDRITVLPVYVIGGLATYWFIDRSLPVFF